MCTCVCTCIVNCSAVVDGTDHLCTHTHTHTHTQTHTHTPHTHHTHTHTHTHRITAVPAMDDAEYHDPDQQQLSPPPIAAHRAYPPPTQLSTAPPIPPKVPVRPTRSLQDWVSTRHTLKHTPPWAVRDVHSRIICTEHLLSNCL